MDAALLIFVAVGSGLFLLLVLMLFMWLADRTSKKIVEEAKRNGKR